MPFTRTTPLLSLLILFCYLSTVIVTVHCAATSKSPPLVTPAANLILPSDAVSLLSFKTKADLDNKLLYELHERFDYCQWQGVKCAQGRVVHLILQGFGLRGEFAPDTLTRLNQLRVLTLTNNSLSGPIPDLSLLVNLKSLFLDQNSFSSSFPPSILLLFSLQVLDLSHNNLTGPIPFGLNELDRLSSLRLDSNGFNGSLPPLNQSTLQVFNVSANNLTGSIPATPTLLRFDTTSFQSNPNLCGEIINKACESRTHFFDSPKPNNDTSPSAAATTTTTPLGQSAQSQSGMLISPPSPKHKSTGLILGSSIGVSLLIASLLFAFGLVKNKKGTTSDTNAKSPDQNPKTSTTTSFEATPRPNSTAQAQEAEENDIVLQLRKSDELRRVQKSGNLVFCGGEAQVYNLEMLMRASAELLGRGTVGTTYKAVLDNQLVLTVKRMDANKTAITSSQVFDHHMAAVGRLRHPNLVPIRAYFQAKGERLVIYDYQANGSLFSLIHGSRSTRAKSLHWTSCLKIAEDVAQGLAYIHQVSRLIHGNLKSSNVLLGADFEACVTDYCLAVLVDSSNEDPDSAGYKAPETRRSNSRATLKSDVYSFGILLLELLTSKHPSQHPFLAPTDVPNWVRAMREDDGGEDNRLGMLTEVACICSVTSPEQRPAMWQVLKMIQEIKENVMVEENSSLESS
ncbi:probable inactive receptor kinase At5g67200 [Quercus robur]|uniref:probable inactive receptor kinase At5g67200 n=1 Tax=Quercus robur TaxID=38942 RepID=UPI0021632C7B|nr:probable inactive receptor kinase At5g67200 [Quercus robur]